MNLKFKNLLAKKEESIEQNIEEIDLKEEKPEKPERPIRTDMGPKHDELPVEPKPTPVKE